VWAARAGWGFVASGVSVAEPGMEFVLQHSKQNQHQAALIGAAHTTVAVTEQL